MLKHRLVSVSTAIIVASIFSAPAYAKTTSAPGMKTAGVCEGEYQVNKGALKDAKEKKNDFIAACRALAPGTPTPIGTAAAPAPVPAPQKTTAPASQSTVAPRPAPAQPAPTTARPPRPAPSSATAPTAANQFLQEAQAKAHCPAATVVWVNTKSKVYHFAGTHNYGTTKLGVYMCESDGESAGDRAPLNEKHP